MRIDISSEIEILNATKEIYDYCKKELTIDNPDYIKKSRLGKWTGNTPRKLHLYKQIEDKLVIPVGALRDIISLVKFYGIPVVVSNEITEFEKMDFHAEVNLYDYQKKAVDAMVEKGYGILKSKAGSGKTQMGIAIACRLGKKTLWITHTQDLLKQSYDRAVSCGIDKKMLGKITAGKIQIGSGITFATVQTLAKQDLTKLKNEFGCIIVDECHRCSGSPTAATQFSKVLSNLAAEHKFGLSATVHRADGMIKTTYLLLGPVSYEVPDEAIADKVMDVRVKKIMVPMDELPDECLDTDGTIVWARLINSLCENCVRNQQINNILVDNKEHYNLILSDRLEHLERLQDMLPQEIQEQSVLITGKMTSKKSREEREQAIEDMKAGKKHFLFASYKLAKEGLDIPRLDRLHMVTPQKDYAVITQCIGRVARTFEGKTDPVCYDYVDDMELFENMWKKRCTSYRKGGCIL